MTPVAGYFAVVVTFALALALFPALVLGLRPLGFSPLRVESEILRFITGVNIWNDDRNDGFSLKTSVLPLVAGMLLFGFWTACKLTGLVEVPTKPTITGAFFAALFLLRAILGPMEGFSQFYVPEKPSNFLDRNIMSPIFLLLGLCFIIVTIGSSS